jgi:UDP-N-acetylmuramate dehydrogenase
MPTRIPLNQPHATLLNQYAHAVDPERVRRNVPLAPLTTFRIGGPADLFYRARTPEELCRALGVARQLGLPSFVLGRGANILVADEGVRGVVIRCDIATMEFGPGGRVVAGAGVDVFPDLINATVARGLGGLHYFVGIPSTVGGAVLGNLHFLAAPPARERTMFWEDSMEGATILTPDGEMRYERTEHFRFRYNYSVIQDTGDIVLDVSLKLVPTPTREIQRVMRENLAWRNERFPALWLYPYAGSVFKMIDGINAGRLIEECGLKGRGYGAAQIYHRHANMVVNLGGATAAEVMTLIDLSRETVARELGYELETEIEFVGAF